MEKAPTLRAALTCDVVYCIQGNCIDRADTAGCNGKGVRGGQSYTLNTIDRHAVCYRKATKPGGGKGEKWQEDTTTNTLNAFEFHSDVRSPEIVIYKKEETHDKDLPTSDMQLHPVR